MTQQITARSGDLVVLVGTRKGAFILTGDDARSRWQISGPISPGTDIFHLVYDGRNGGRLLSASNSMWFGPQVEYSSDLGKTWEQSRAQPRFSGKPEYAEHDGPTVSRIWHIEPGPASEPATLYAGVQPAALFKSTDHGVTWQEVEGLSGHPTRSQWQPGFGGLCLHSIALDPSNVDRIWVGISAAGVFRTEDGGETWQPTNRGVRADFNPGDPLPEWGQCPHKLLPHPAKRRASCTSRTIAAFTAPPTAATNGRTLPGACLPASASCWRCIRGTPIPCSCCPRMRPLAPMLEAEYATFPGAGAGSSAAEAAARTGRR